MRPSINEIREVLKQIMPEYWPISQERDHPGQELYKACDADGNIYLITSPSAWKYESSEPNGQGQRIYHRPPPKKVMTWGEARRQAGSTDSDLPAARGAHGLRF